VADDGVAATKTTTAAQDSSEPVVDDAVGSVASYRRLGQVYVTLLAGIPGATLLAGIIKAPGENGFDAWDLVIGLVLVAIAVALGLTLVTWLRAPIELKDGDLEGFEMARILGARHAKYNDLLGHIQRLANTANLSSAARADLANSAKVRRQVFQLAAADRMRSRVLNWKTALLVGSSLAFITAGVALLALAPKPKTSGDKSAVSVVTVKLTPAGKKAFGCSTEDFSALRIGGTDDAPQVVPLGTTCTKGSLLALTVGTEKKSATSAKTVTAAEAELPSGGGATPPGTTTVTTTVTQTVTTTKTVTSP
jgi:hypothetical protein